MPWYKESHGRLTESYRILLKPKILKIQKFKFLWLIDYILIMGIQRSGYSEHQFKILKWMIQSELQVT
jgi:hypothetical protein